MNWSFVSIAALLLTAVGAGAYVFYVRPAAKPQAAVDATVPAQLPGASSSPDSLGQSAISGASTTSTPSSGVTTEFNSPSNWPPLAGQPAAADKSSPLPGTTVRQPITTELAGPRGSGTSAASRQGKTPPIASSQPAAIAQSNPIAKPLGATALRSTSSALNSRPVARRRSAVAPVPAPALDATASSSDSGSLPAIPAAPVALPVPVKPVSDTPVRVRVGGLIKPPKIISSVMPTYPPIARNAGVQGNVTLDVVIDKVGNVSQAKAVSGPPMLRQAALDAVRQWKYEPSMLDGQPASIEMIVSMQFHQ